MELVENRKALLLANQAAGGVFEIRKYEGEAFSRSYQNESFHYYNVTG